MTDTAPNGRLHTWASGIRTAARQATIPARLLLVAKTALAVGIAWLVAPHMPGVVNDYPYYAPLGALISMYPTLMGSVRSGLQTILGLAAGIGLATVVILTVGPTWWSIPAVVGVAVLFSGTGWFGAGREYVPMAALFVLIIGGAEGRRLLARLPGADGGRGDDRSSRERADRPRAAHRPGRGAR